MGLGVRFRLGGDASSDSGIIVFLLIRNWFTSKDGWAGS